MEASGLIGIPIEESGRNPWQIHSFKSSLFKNDVLNTLGQHFRRETKKLVEITILTWECILRKKFKKWWKAPRWLET